MQEILVSSPNRQTSGKGAYKIINGGTKTSDVLSPPKKGRSKHTRKIKVKINTVHTRKPTNPPRKK